MNKEVNALGMACPLPVVLTKDALKGLAAGDTVTTLVDNFIAVQNLGKFARVKGYDSAAKKLEDGTYQVVTTVPADATEQIHSQEDLQILDCQFGPGDYTVVISSDRMGEGDAKLGAILMKAFIFSLTKLDLLPKQMIFYNSGAFLTCEDSPTLEDLKTLEKAGTSICTCGTCLDFYNLKDRLQVGMVSNMYEIAELLTTSGRIVKP